MLQTLQTRNVKKSCLILLKCKSGLFIQPLFFFFSEYFAYSPGNDFTLLAASSQFGNERIIVLDGNIFDLGQSNQLPQLSLYDDGGDILCLIINPDYSKIQISSYKNVSA